MTSSEPEQSERPGSLDPAGEDFYRALLDDDPVALYEQAPCGYLSTTPDGTIIKVNQTFLTWTGYRHEDLVGRRTFSSLLSPGGRIYHDTHYAPMLRMQGRVREIALDLVLADGRRRPVLVNAALERDIEDRPTVVRVVLFDATERREYERELLHAKQRAEESEARARALARTLQQTFIPPQPPRIPGIDVSAVYRPAGTGEEVGGDFYDVFQLGEDNWAVVLGDVCGKGVEAAVVTSLARHSVRALTVGTSSPAEVMQSLNDIVLHHPNDRFCTVALVRLRRVEGGWRLTLSLGGHPQPVLVTPEGRATQIGEPGSLVGVFDDVDHSETDLVLAPGATLVLYTDGVTEARRGAEEYGDARLLQAAEAHRRADVLTAGLLEEVLEFQAWTPSDDIAIVAIGVPAGAD